MEDGLTMKYTVKGGEIFFSRNEENVTKAAVIGPSITPGSCKEIVVRKNWKAQSGAIFIPYSSGLAYVQKVPLKHTRDKNRGILLQRGRWLFQPYTSR